MKLFILLLVVMTFSPVVNGMDLPYVNWENHPVHPLDRSPDGRLLAVAHTADNRIQLFDITGPEPRGIGHIPVGIDPVSVRFLSNSELWVANHISDSVSVIDITTRRIKATLSTKDEPFDIVFAGNPLRAFVSCSQANIVQVFNPAALNQAPTEILIAAEDPRAMAVSPDGSEVYVAIFESGNASTILGAHNVTEDDPPNTVLFSDTPYGGESPPPNDGNQFSPPENPKNYNPTRSGLIIKKDSQGRWMDDNEGDWTAWVSGPDAARSGRVVGWDMPDRDIAVIDAQSLEVTWAHGLMNIGMAIAVNPLDGGITLVGTDATNEVRFEPNLSGRFLHVMLASVDADNLQSVSVLDLNPHLDYSAPTRPQSERNQSIGDPRGITWMTAGDRGYVAGMGSNSVVAINRDGTRAPGVAPMQVGNGPVGLALDEATSRLFVWNHFDATLATIDLVTHTVAHTTAMHSPLPAAIVNGRRHFYDTHATSGLGQAACASCHVDGRIDRLAWDLGDPAGSIKVFNQNCGTRAVGFNCVNFHPMKGPMLTQTMQDIIGKEPFHWRGDRDGLEEFNSAFIDLMGDDELLSAQAMQQFEDFLATIHYPPNPYRNLDNSLSGNLPLPGHVGNGRFSEPGTPLPDGNAKNGLVLFTDGLLDELVPIDGLDGDGVSCVHCHSLPTGLAPNGRFFDPVAELFLGGLPMQPGPNGENHLLITGSSTVQDMTMKFPSLRNLYERVGYETKLGESNAGFGFLHDGTIDSLAHYMELNEFRTTSSQEVADLVAFMLSFSGSDLPANDEAFDGEPIDSQDTHAAVGQQVLQKNGNAGGRLSSLLNLANSGSIELVAHQSDGLRFKGWLYESSGQTFIPDAGDGDLNLAGLLALATDERPVSFMAVPFGLGMRLGLDRDGDGIHDGVEIAQYSNPADAQSTAFAPEPGLWFNPARSGHGMDLERSGNNMVATWYTYREDGTPHWYQAAGGMQGTTWTAELYQAVWVPAQGGIEVEVVGTMTMDFSTPQSAGFSWQIGDQSGSEPFSRFQFAIGYTPHNYTGLWYDQNESGWGVSVDSLAGIRTAVVFFYDADNQPRWVLGSGSNATGTEFEMSSFTGFCPWCETVPTTNQPGGTLTFQFEGYRSATLEMTVDYPAVSNSEFTRSTGVLPLTDADVKPVSH